MTDGDRHGGALLDLAAGRVLREHEPVLGRVGHILLDDRHREPCLLQELRRGLPVVLVTLGIVTSCGPLETLTVTVEPTATLGSRRRALRDDGALGRAVAHVGAHDLEPRALERPGGVRVRLVHHAGTPPSSGP